MPIREKPVATAIVAAKTAIRRRSCDLRKSAGFRMYVLSVDRARR
jgi:hypothetical protein